MDSARPGFWAALAVAATLAHFLLCWYVLRGVAVGTPWGLISVALAVPFLVGAERLARWRETMPGATEALGYCAAGVAFFIAVAIALEFNREWITVAYAVSSPPCRDRKPAWPQRHAPAVLAVLAAWSCASCSIPRW